MERITAEDARTTYRQLRIAMPVLVVVLTAGVVYQVFVPAPDCWLGSISAYYYTSARAVFVACLCAIGACLVIYRGSTPREDALLNVPGFLAFVVAFIPTPLRDLEVPPDNCAHSNVPTEVQLEAALDNNITALLVGAAATVAVIGWFQLMSRSQGAVRPRPVVFWAPAVTVVAAWVLFVASPHTVRQYGHIAAAAGVFAGIVVVALVHAFPLRLLDPDAQPARRPYLAWYRGVFLLMAAALVVLGPVALAHTVDHAVFWLEGSIITLFAVFWIVQTVELWGVAGSTAVPER